MISESFLRNYSIKKILTTAAIQKEKLKVYYAKNSIVFNYLILVRQIFKENHPDKVNKKKFKKKYQQPQVFYRYTVNNSKQNNLKERKSKNSQQQYYHGKPKTPIRCRQVRLKVPKQIFESLNQNNKLTNDLSNAQQIQINRSISSKKSRTKSKTKRQNKCRNTVGCIKKDNFFYEPAERQATLLSKSSDIPQQVKEENCEEALKIINNALHAQNSISECKIYLQKPSYQRIQRICLQNCLQNKQIVKYSSRNQKKDNFILFREESLKKSIERAERFKKLIKKKYMQLGVNKFHWTQIQQAQQQSLEIRA